MKYRKHLQRVILILLVFLFGATTQLQARRVKFSTSTPHKTVASHLYYLKKDSYDPLLAAYTLAGNLPVEKKKILAKKLRQIIIKHGINIKDIPNTRRLRNGSNVYVLFSDIPEIFLKRIDKEWLYSAETVSKIEEIYSAMYPLPKTNKKKKRIIINAGNNQKGAPEFSQATPYNTIVSHIFFLNDTIYRPELSAKCFNSGVDSLGYNIDLAIKLKQIFLGAGITVIDIDKVPKDTNYIDTILNKEVYLPNRKYPELYLEKIDGKWYYSRTTCDLIPSVHEKLFQGEAENIFGFGKWFKQMAGKSNAVYFGLELWQIYMALTFITVGILVLLLVSLLIRFLFRKVKNSPFIRPLRRLIKLIILLFYFYEIRKYIPSFDLPISYSLVLSKLVSVGIVIFYTLSGIHLTTLWVLYSTRKKIQNNIYGIIIFVSYIIKTIILVIGLLYIVKVMEYNLVNFLAGLSIGGFAFALGAQDTIKNFFGSLMIFADKSFNVGDWIVTDEVSGTVEQIGLRSTKIRTFHNSLVTVPNNKIIR